MDERAPRGTGFRAEHPVFFWGTVSLIALLAIAAAAVGWRIPRYNREADEIASRMNAEQRRTRGDAPASHATDADSRARGAPLAARQRRKEQQRCGV